MAEAYIVAAARTAGGKRGGRVSGWHPVDLAAQSRIMTDTDGMAMNIYDPNQKQLQVTLPGLEIGDAVRAVESALGDRGRVLLRPSGTEPVIRVMVEGHDAAQVERHARALADVVRSAAA